MHVSLRSFLSAGLALLALGVAFLAGCGSPQIPVDKTYDSDAARAALIATLDAWRDGKAAGLSKGNPPIRFSDDDFFAGLKLERYELSTPEAPIEAYRDVRVKLFLKNSRGQALEREASYQVSLSPMLAVLRSDS